MAFHPLDADWILYAGGTICPGCHTEMYYSINNGKSWSKLTTWAQKCIFAYSEKFKKVPKETVYCIEYKDKSQRGTAEQDSLHGRSTPNNPLQLVKTLDWGRSWQTVLQHTIDMAVMGEFLAFSRVIFILSYRPIIICHRNLAIRELWNCILLMAISWLKRSFLRIFLCKKKYSSLNY